MKRRAYRASSVQQAVYFLLHDVNNSTLSAFRLGMVDSRKIVPQNFMQTTYACMYILEKPDKDIWNFPSLWNEYHDYVVVPDDDDDDDDDNDYNV